MKIAIVIHEDRHGDTEVHAFTALDAAIEKAKSIVAEFSRSHDYVIENTFRGAPYSATYSGEGDGVRVAIVEVRGL